MTSAIATARFTSWDEEPSFEGDAPLPRLAHAVVAFAYEGDLQGTSSCRYVLSYASDGTGVGVGFEEVTGSLGGVEGTLVLRHEAVFGPEGVETTYQVVPGASTGGLAGATGSGGYSVGHGASEWSWALDYEVP